MSRYKAAGFALTFSTVGILGGASVPIILLFLGILFLFGILS